MLDGRARKGADGRKAIGVPIRRAIRNVPVVPGRHVVELVVLVVHASDPAHTPLVRRAQTEFVLPVLIALRLMPGGPGRVAERDRSGRVVVARPDTLVVIGVHTAGVIGVITDLVDIALQVTAGID